MRLKQARKFPEKLGGKSHLLEAHHLILKLGGLVIFFSNNLFPLDFGVFRVGSTFHFFKFFFLLPMWMDFFEVSTVDIFFPKKLSCSPGYQMVRSSFRGFCNKCYRHAKSTTRHLVVTNDVACLKSKPKMTPVTPK